MADFEEGTKPDFYTYPLDGNETNSVRLLYDRYTHTHTHTHTPTHTYTHIHTHAHTPTHTIVK